MGFWEWMGFENPRDSPKTEQPKEGLPQVTDNVRDSGQTFVFGRSNAGEQVDEKAAMQIPTVYACVRLLAESIAALPLHLYRVTDDNGNKEKARDHPLYKILYRQPNPEMTSFVFWETLMTHLLLWGNAYAQIVRDGKNTVLGLYPLLPENVEVDRDESGELYYIYHAYTDEVPGEQNKDIYFRRDEIFHVPGLGFNGLIGFSPIAMMKNSLGTSIAVDKYGSSFFKNGAQPSGVLEHPGVVKDPNRIRDSWEAAYGGASNAHRVAVLEEGMHEELDGNGVLAENANVELEHFAFLFEFDGDQRHIRHVLYNCVASRPSIEGETNEDSKEVKTDTLNLQATPLANGYVKAKTGTNTTDDVYNKWYDAVYEPQAEAVDTEDTSHTEEPQG